MNFISRFKDILIKHKKVFLTFFSVLLILIVSIFLVLNFIKPGKKINNIFIYNSYDPEEIKKTINIKTGDPLFKVNKQEKKIEKNINNIDFVENSSVKIDDNNNVVINIKNKDIAGYFLKDGKYSLIFTDDYKIKETDSPSYNIPFFINFSDDEKLEKTSKNIVKIKKNIYKNISQVVNDKSSSNKDRILFFFNDGTEVIANASDFNDKIDYLDDIVRKNEKTQVVNMEKDTIISRDKKE